MTTELCNVTLGPPGVWALVERRLSPRTSAETCDLAIGASIVVALGTFLASSALSIHVFRRLHRSRQPFSLLLLSLVVSDAVGATAVAVQTLSHTLFASLHSNASCLHPSRGRWLRLFDVPACGMLVTGALLLLACCGDRVQSIAAPNTYRLVNRRRRCVRMNALCYGVGWTFALLSHCLVLNTGTLGYPRRKPFPFATPTEVLAHPLSKRWLEKLCSESPDTVSSDFWYAHLNRQRVCSVSRDNFERDRRFPPLLPLPTSLQVKATVDLALGLATVVLVVVYVRRPRLVGTIGSRLEERRKAEEERQRERGVCVALGAEAALASLSGLPAALLYKLLRPLLASNSSHRTAIIVLGLGIGTLPQYLITGLLIMITSSIQRKELFRVSVFCYRPRFCHHYLFIYLVFVAPMLLLIALVWLVRYAAFGHASCS